MMFCAFNRETAKITEDNPERAFKQFGFAKVFGVCKAEFTAECKANDKIPTAGMRAHNDHEFFNDRKKNLVRSTPITGNRGSIIVSCDSNWTDNQDYKNRLNWII